MQLRIFDKNLQKYTLPKLLDYALVYHSLKEYQKAIDNYNKAIELNPQYAFSYQYKGWCYKALGKSNLAEKDFAMHKKLSAGQ